MRFIILLLIVGVVLAETPTPSTIDPSSYANIDQITTDNYILDWVIDFDAEAIKGTITLEMKTIADCSQIILDVVALNIISVKDENGDDLDYSIQEGNPNLGDAMVIDLGQTLASGKDFVLVIDYETTDGAMALSWMKPEQTSSKTLHYLFSQCESIFARTMAPLQDTPSMKSSYTASVEVEEGYTVVMSAYLQDQTENSNDGTVTFSFYQDIKIPSYLLAIAVGDINYSPVGTRTGIYADPVVMDSALAEYEDLELFLDTAEAYMTPYLWNEYNILFLPPSFPYGGMENPLMTFYNPVLIVGDKSLTYIATHEISHSWTGNDLTCGDWSNLWLNEGFTTFEERKVSGELYGDNFALTEFFRGNNSLISTIESLGEDDLYASLHPDFQGADPDLYSTDVVYEKGAQFLVYLENIVGEIIFQDFLRTWINDHKFESVFVEQLQQDWETYITDKVQPDDPDTAAEALAVDWDTWINKPGYIPADSGLNFMNPDVEEALDLADFYADEGGQRSPDYSNWPNFDANQKMIFVDQLNKRSEELTLLVLQRVDADLSITQDPNPGVKSLWQTFAIAFDYIPVFDYAHEFVSTCGRTLYIAPIYDSLIQNGYRYLAYEWFEENEDFYHPITVAQLKSMLLAQEELTEDDLKNIQRYNNAIASGRVFA